MVGIKIRVVGQSCKIANLIKLNQSDIGCSVRRHAGNQRRKVKTLRSQKGLNLRHQTILSSVNDETEITKLKIISENVKKIEKIAVIKK